MVKRRVCQLCGRHLPARFKHAVWCTPCVHNHATFTPCPACNGIIHIVADGDRVDIWKGFDKV